MSFGNLDLNSKEFKEKTYNDWWLFGENALTYNCADKMVNIECNLSLIKETYKISDKNYDYTYSKCPLIPSYIDKKEIILKKKGYSLEDYFIFD